MGNLVSEMSSVTENGAELKKNKKTKKTQLFFFFQVRKDRQRCALRGRVVCWEKRLGVGSPGLGHRG